MVEECEIVCEVSGDGVHDIWLNGEVSLVETSLVILAPGDPDKV